MGEVFFHRLLDTEFQIVVVVYTYPVKSCTGIGAGPIHGECVVPLTSRTSPVLLTEQLLMSQCLTCPYVVSCRIVRSFTGISQSIAGK